MFYFDLTAEDNRMIATEHRVPISAEKASVYKDHGEPFNLMEHDGTFDVLHSNNHTGETYTINLTMEELAAVIHLGLAPDDVAFLYSSVHIKKYQELMKDHPQCSWIP